MKDMAKHYTRMLVLAALAVPRRAFDSVVGVKDKLVASVVRLFGCKDGIKLIGRVDVEHMDRFGNLLSHETAHNTVVALGLAEIVDALVSSANGIAKFRYVAFGTNSTASAGSQTALVSEVSGGSYARLNASQGEGSQTYIYKIGQSTWTNLSGSSQNIKEYGCLNSTASGIMFARYALADGGITAKNVAPSEQLKVTWTWSFADA